MINFAPYNKPFTAIKRLQTIFGDSQRPNHEGTFQISQTIRPSLQGEYPAEHPLQPAHSLFHPLFVRLHHADPADAVPDLQRPLSIYGDWVCRFQRRDDQQFLLLCRDTHLHRGGVDDARPALRDPRGDDFLHVSSDTPPSGFAKDLPNSWQEVSSKLGRVNYEFLEMNAVIF